MSAEVFIEVIRKKDHRPQGKFFLGGNSFRNALIFNSVEMDEVEIGFQVKGFADAQDTINFLAGFDNETWQDNRINELNEYLYDVNRDTFAYWLVLEC